jgi:hypothetical protein
MTFDCEKPREKLETVVCDDVTLSKDERLLRAKLAKRLSGLSERRKSRRLAEQRSWEQFVTIACKVAASDQLNTHSNRQQIISCLDELYNERIRAIGYPGGLERNFYAAAAVPAEMKDGSGHHPDIATLEISYLELDHGNNASASAINRKILQGLHKYYDSWKTEGGSDLSVNMNIEYMSREFISIRVDEYEYHHGTPHGDGVTAGENLLLPGARALQPVDIFDMIKDWQGALSSYCADALAERSSDRKPLVVREAAMGQFRGSIGNPGFWTISPGGLHIYFGRLGSVPDGNQDCQVPWSFLLRYISPDPKIKIPPKAQ